LRGLVLALLALEEDELSADIEPGIIRGVLKITRIMYSVVNCLLDSAPGMMLPRLKSLLGELKPLWLSLSCASGISELPPAVHALFHFPLIIEKFGAPILYAAYAEESGHVEMKSNLNHNNNRNQGESETDYLEQIMVKGSRTVVIRFMEAIETFANRDGTRQGFVQRVGTPRGEDDLVSAMEASVEVFRSFFPSFDFPPFAGPQTRSYSSVFVQADFARAGDWAVRGRHRLCWNATKGSDLRVFAFAPQDANYAVNLSARLAELGGCECPACFACSEVELGRTLAINNFTDTRDVLMCPFIYVQDCNGVVFLLGIQLEVIRCEDDCSFVVRPVGELVLFDMMAFRGECACVQAGPSMVALEYVVVLERFRGSNT
jgi:hypothetical protein